MRWSIGASEPPITREKTAAGLNLSYHFYVPGNADDLAIYHSDAVRARSTACNNECLSGAQCAGSTPVKGSYSHLSDASPSDGFSVGVVPSALAEVPNREITTMGMRTMNWRMYQPVARLAP
ncbi:MAG: hypothetical protein JKY56_01055 [Kofleriaceae bacterium]|nr:hypothetical protein [Kofleriaceae bacterium]